jgi:hypothetical protein
VLLTEGARSGPPALQLNAAATSMVATCCLQQLMRLVLSPATKAVFLLTAHPTPVIDRTTCTDFNVDVALRRRRARLPLLLYA